MIFVASIPMERQDYTVLAINIHAYSAGADTDDHRFSNLTNVNQEIVRTASKPARIGAVRR